MVKLMMQQWIYGKANMAHQDMLLKGSWKKGGVSIEDGEYEFNLICRELLRSFRRNG